MLSPKLVVEATLLAREERDRRDAVERQLERHRLPRRAERRDRRHRVLRAGQRGDQQPVLGEGDHDPRQPPDSGTASCTSRSSTTTSTSARARRSPRRTARSDGDRRADRRYPAGDHRARPDLPRDPRQLRRGAPDPAALRRLLRAGHVHGRRSADDPPGRALRAADAGRPDRQRRRHDGERPDAQRELGAAHRRDVRRDGQRPLEDLRQLGPLLREDPERPRRARAVGRRGHQPRRLLRRRPDAADSGRHAHDHADARQPAGVDDEPLPAAGRRRRPDRSEREVVVRRRVRHRLRVRGAAEHERRRALHPPVDPARPRGRRAVPGRRVRPSRAWAAASTTRSRTRARARRC